MDGWIATHSTTPTLSLGALSGSEWFALGLLVLGAALLAIPSVRLILVRGRATPSAPEPVHDRVERFARITRERAALESLMKDVRELTTLCAQQIDARSARLERLIEQAEEAAERLEQAGANAPFTPPHHAPLPRSAPPFNETPPQPVVETRRVSVRDPQAPQHDPAEPLASRVYAMADEGRSPVEIASALSEHVGKVELMLALRA